MFSLKEISLRESENDFSAKGCYIHLSDLAWVSGVSLLYFLQTNTMFNVWPATSTLFWWTALRLAVLCITTFSSQLYRPIYSHWTLKRKSRKCSIDFGTNQANAQYLIWRFFSRFFTNPLIKHYSILEHCFWGRKRVSRAKSTWWKHANDPYKDPWWRYVI